MSSSSSSNVSLLSLHSKSLSSLLVQAILYTFTASLALHFDALHPHTDFSVAPCFLNTGIRPSFSISSHPFPMGEGSCGLAFKDASISHTDNCNDVNAVLKAVFTRTKVWFCCGLLQNILYLRRFMLLV